jgi:cell division septation protein DedD
VPELTHDTAEDGFHEIQLSGKQLIFLFMTATVVSVVIFLCGVLVGRNVTASRGVPSDVASAPSSTPSTGVADAGPPAAEPPAPPAEDELSYHKRLQSSGPVEEPKPQAPVAAAPPQAPPTPAPQQAAGPDVPTSGRPGTWFIQVHALQNRATAAGIIKNLLAKGYPAYLENPAPGAPAIYRVRIGRYGDRREADQVARRLQKEEQFNPEVRR